MVTISPLSYAFLTFIIISSNNLVLSQTETILCDGNQLQCNHQTIQCESSNNHCSINCIQGTNPSNSGCSEATVVCPIGYECTINCSFSCKDLTIYAEESTGLSIHGCTDVSCSNITVYCPKDSSLKCMINNNRIASLSQINTNTERNSAKSISFGKNTHLLIAIIATLFACLSLCIFCIMPYYCFRIKQLKKSQRERSQTLRNMDIVLNSNPLRVSSNNSLFGTVRFRSATETNISTAKSPTPVIANITQNLFLDTPMAMSNADGYGECNKSAECDIVQRIIEITNKFNELTAQMNRKLTADEICKLILHSIYRQINTEAGIISRYNYYLFTKNDYNHILHCHDDDKYFHYIHAKICSKENGYVCDVEQCRSIIHSPNDELTVSLFDQLHSHFVHSYETGMRVRPLPISDTPMRDSNTPNYSLLRKCSQTTSNTLVYYQSYHNASYVNEEGSIINSSLQIHMPQSRPYQSTVCESETVTIAFTTERDSDMSSYYDNDDDTATLKVRNIQNILTKARQSRYVSEVVTEASPTVIDHAISHEIMSEFTEISQPKIMDDVKDEKDINNGVYEFGVRWMYWEKYKSDKYFVKAKFPTFKEELLDLQKRQFFQLSDWKAVYAKSVINLNSYNGRHLVCNASPLVNYYGLHLVKNKSPMQLQHMMALVIYCHFDKLQHYLKQSFHKITNNEKLSSIKIRNKCYGNWSKYLRESVELYGNLMRDTKKIKFFHGIVGELVFPTTIAKFCTPTSFTSSVSTAQSFCGESGIILQLEMYGLDVSYFDCRWISDYSNEQEQLVCGGYDCFIISNIILSRLGHSYEQYLNAINVILSLIQCKFNPATIDKKTVQIIKTMIVYCVTSIKPNIYTIPEYVLTLFDCIRQNWKTEIKISVPQLKDAKYYKGIKDLFIDSDGQWMDLNIICKMFVHCPKITICGDSESYGILLTNKTFYKLQLFLSALTPNNKLNQIRFEAPNESVLNGKNAQIQYTQQFEKLNFIFNYDKVDTDVSKGVASIFITKTDETPR